MGMKEFLVILIDEIDRAYCTALGIELYDRLVLEGNFTLIDKLRRVEKREPGYGTIVYYLEGFSPNIITHNMVLDWLKVHDVNVIRLNRSRKELSCVKA